MSTSIETSHAPMMSIGIMSGTSCDGADAIMLRLSSVNEPNAAEVIDKAFVAYPESLQKELTDPSKLTVARIASLNVELADIYFSAAAKLVGYKDARCVGMHGQTVWHMPPSTLQLGSSARLAQRLNLPVVGDLRGADLAWGGQGAPIVPFAHWFFSAAAPTPSVVVNFGGICNVTFVTKKCDDVLGFDVGPGMALSNAFARLCSDNRQVCDYNGELSRGGKRVPALFDAIVSHPFVRQKPPKSTGREVFGLSYFNALMHQHRGQHNNHDVAMTLLEATAEILWRSVGQGPHMKSDLKRVILAGGGALNPTLCELVKKRFVGLEVNVETTGVLAPANHESAAMALIAARTMHQLPSSLIKVTGASRAAILGHVHVPS